MLLSNVYEHVKEHTEQRGQNKLVAALWLLLFLKKIQNACRIVVQFFDGIVLLEPVAERDHFKRAEAEDDKLDSIS